MPIPYCVLLTLNITKINVRVDNLSAPRQTMGQINPVHDCLDMQNYKTWRNEIITRLHHMHK